MAAVLNSLGVSVFSQPTARLPGRERRYMSARRGACFPVAAALLGGAVHAVDCSLLRIRADSLVAAMLDYVYLISLAARQRPIFGVLCSWVRLVSEKKPKPLRMMPFSAALKEMFAQPLIGFVG